jgi:hypothetical protein
MAKPTGPLLSLGASGQIAKTLVAATWKGQPYFRQYVIPSNPQSTAQTATRTVFSWANSVWKIAGPNFQAPWNLFATGQVLTGRNAFLGSQVANLRGQSDLSQMVFSPGAKGGLAATALALTPGAGTLQAVITAPALPTGWTIDEAAVVAIRDQDPSTGVLTTTYEDVDASSPYDITLSSLPADTYYLGAWFKFTKADGSTAYGPSISDTAVVT